MTASALVRSIFDLAVGPDQRRAAALHAIDTIAALEAGLATGEGAAIARFYGDGEPARRAAGMAAVVRYTECDDIEVPSCLTPGCIAVPVALEFAPDAGRFASAVSAGYAAGLAIARGAGGARALAHGVWPTLLAAPAIAATTAAVALGMDQDRTVHALSLSLAGCSGRAGRPAGNPSGRWLAIGEAAHHGVRCALASEAGFGGDPELLSAQWLAAQSAPELVDAANLDVSDAVPLHAVGFKAVVAARQAANAIEALGAIVREGLDPGDVRSIEVRLPSSAIPVVTRPLDVSSRLSTIAHLGLQLGIVLHEPQRLHDVSREAAFRPETLDLASRVDVVADAALERPGLASFPAVVTVRGAAGEVVRECLTCPGDVGDTDPAAMLQRKFTKLGAGPDVTGLLNRAANGDDIFDAARNTAGNLWRDALAVDAGGRAAVRLT